MSPSDQSSDTRADRNSYNVYTQKLLRFASLSDTDRHVLDSLSSHEDIVAKGSDIAQEGENPSAIFLIKKGMAARYRTLADGGRQILTFMIPGDICDMDAFLMRTRDHSICALNLVRAVSISRETINRVLTEHPQIALAMRRSSLQEHSMLRERVVSLGRRDARSRIAYLLCELFWRHDAVGLADAAFQLPLTQTELGDSLGLTQVHVNRVIKNFRERGLIAILNRKVVVLDVERLQDVAEISRDYLDPVKFLARSTSGTMASFQ